MLPGTQAVKSVFLCSFARHDNEPIHYSRRFTRLEDAETEACILQSAGYRGCILGAVEPFFDESNNSFRDYVVIDQF